MDRNKSNTSIFSASKETPKEGQITANYWIGEKKSTCIYCDEEHHRSYPCEKVKTLGDTKIQNYCNKRAMLQLHWNWSSRSWLQKQKKLSKLWWTSSFFHLQQELNSWSTTLKGSCTNYNRNERCISYYLQINWITCRALLDTGVGISNASATLTERIIQQPIKKGYKSVKMMLHTTTKTVDIFQVQISSLDGRFEISTEVNKVEKSKLLSLPNPKCEELLNRHNH